VRKEALEAESEAITGELTSPPNGDDTIPPMGIDTPLVDSDGYPRGDVDVYRARTLRGRLAVIRTDRGELMREIEQSLVQLAAFKNPNKKKAEEKELQARLAPKPKPKFDPKTGKWVVKNWNGAVAGVPGGDKRSFDNLDNLDEEATESLATQPGKSRDQSQQQSQDAQKASAAKQSLQLSPESLARQPFCRVDAVANDSPAAAAGLREEDLIVEFGPIHETNNNNLRAIAALVPDVAGEKGTIYLLIKRSNGNGTAAPQYARLELKPRPWSGRGLLGCHIVPHTATA